MSPKSNLEISVSVILPVYNGADYIKEALQSIFSQGYPSIEVIVIDDGSTDDLHSSLKLYRDQIVFFRQENKGPASARNLGLEAAQGDIIAFADADDVWPKMKLKKQLEILKSDKELDVVVGRQKIEYLHNAREKEWNLSVDTRSVICQSMPVAMMRRRAFEKIGNFDEELLYCEDWDWHLRAREAGLKMIVHSDVANIHRRHRSNMTHDIKRLNYYLRRMFLKAIQRRRNNPELKGKLPTISELEQKIIWE